MEKIIGIVGGVGPYTGLTINKSIFDNTITSGTDQEHLEVYLFSRSSDITNRTDFLKGYNIENPAEGIIRTIRKLSLSGARVIGIPCNTAHAPQIFNKVKERVESEKLNINLLNMIEETDSYIRESLNNIQKIGLLGTLGTYKTRIFQNVLEKGGTFEVLIPELPEEREAVQMAISDPEFGIKATTNPVSPKAIELLKKAAECLFNRGAQVIIMGCTEIPIALNITVFDKAPLIDPSEVLSRALIREAAPSRLKPLETD